MSGDVCCLSGEVKEADVVVTSCSPVLIHSIVIEVLLLASKAEVVFVLPEARWAFDVCIG